MSESTDLPNRLKQAFPVRSQSRTISRGKLEGVLKVLDPSFTQEDLNVLFGGSPPTDDMELSYDEFIDFVCFHSNVRPASPAGKVLTPPVEKNAFPPAPLAIVLQLEVKEDCVDEFIQVMTADAVGSRCEAGCLRFDLLRDKENPSKFITYEVFKDAAAMEAHREQPYVKAWGAFQYGDKKPIIKKTLLKVDAIDFQSEKCRAQDINTVPTALVLELEIKEECLEEFIQVITADACGSRTEAGCLRFDFLRDKENLQKFILYEVFQSQEAMDVHRNMPYVKAWGAFQYDKDKAPVLSKSLSKNDAIDFQAFQV
eukprot:gnl/MRDRNA2_/MRDRNA2_118110_c0_seq1.p1 gnl/MRDRNA2_/MRDRNA2_118110_c0~~gnl/MRDRNA2_/MRDRNA2_118110_c0_seq1.p1  ORF type:complete len:313 (-),score=76.71 gnl/MRDRNA2_/MRDRNA2_118110_c0_seq1:32-970(-)